MVQGQTYRERESGRYLLPGNAVDPSLVEASWEKMSKSKHNGVEPEVCLLVGVVSPSLSVCGRGPRVGVVSPSLSVCGRGPRVGVVSPSLSVCGRGPRVGVVSPSLSVCGCGPRVGVVSLSLSVCGRGPRVGVVSPSLSVCRTSLLSTVQTLCDSSCSSK